MRKWISFAALLVLAPACVPAQKPAPSPAVSGEPHYVYALKAGETYRYRVTGIFHGQFPPFASPGAPPVNLRIVLDYSASVKKQDKDALEIAFHIEKADLFLLEAEPDQNGKLPPGKEEVNFPIPVEDVQKSLDVTALLKSDGTVTQVSGGNASSAKINFGIELRKLFLLMFPIAFGDALKSPTEGLLGKTSEAVQYRNELVSAGFDARSKEMLWKQTARAQINEMRDGNNQVIGDKDKAASVSTGEAEVQGDLHYTILSKTPAAMPAAYALRLANASYTLKAKVHTKILKPDPAKPEEPTETDVDVTARLSVKPLASPAKVKPASAPPIQKANS